MNLFVCKIANTFNDVKCKNKKMLNLENVQVNCDPFVKTKEIPHIIIYHNRIQKNKIIHFYWELICWADLSPL